MTAMTDLNGKSLARDRFRGSFPFSGEIQDKDGAREITGSISWKTLLSTEDLEDGKRDVLMMFVTRDELGETFGRKVKLDYDFVAQLAAKSRSAREALLSKILKESKKLQNYSLPCA